MNTTTTWTTDNRWSPGASGATVPTTAPAAYSARWIDMGDHTPADVLPDRQGFAYNLMADMLDLGNKLNDAGVKFRTPGSMAREATVTGGAESWAWAFRRSGGYIYVDAWLVPPLAADVAEGLNALADVTVAGFLDGLIAGGTTDIVDDRYELGDRSYCQHCGLDIEYHPGKGPWMDRGGNHFCPGTGVLHDPADPPSEATPQYPDFGDDDEADESELDIVTRNLIDAARHWHRHRHGGSDMALDMAIARYEEVVQRGES